MGLFLDTTQVAIREMMEEFGASSRFGRVFSEEDLEAAAARVAAFLEMTLNLRASVAQGGSPFAPASNGATPRAPGTSGASASMGASTGSAGGRRPSHVRPGDAPAQEPAREPARASTLPRRSGLGLSAGFVDPDLEGNSERGGGLLGRLGFPRTKAAAEVVAQGASMAPAVDSAREDPRLPPQHDLRLPRKRVGASEADRDLFDRARGRG